MRNADLAAMRIAFVSLMAESPWGASEALWTQAAQRALEEGHDVFVSAYRWPQLPTALEALKRRGVQIDSRSRSRWVRRSALVARLMRTFASLGDFKPDIVCLSQGGTYDIARSGSIAELRRSLGRLNTPYILLCHCEQPAPRRRNLRSAREAFMRAAIVGVLAHRARDVAEAHLGMSLPNARVFQNPVNLQRIECLPWPDQSILRLAFVGRLEPVKNLQSLLTVFAQGEWMQREWTLTVFGTGSQRGQLEELVQQQRLTERIRFAGHATDIAAVWAAHHALVMPSLFEGVPLAMLEAMLCGRPVVATDTGGISEWLEDGHCGFLIREPSRVAIAAALERLWDEREELERLGRSAYERTVAKRDTDSAGTLLDWITTEQVPRVVY